MSIEAKRFILYLEVLVPLISYQIIKNPNFFWHFSFFSSNIFQISVLMIQDSSFAWNLGPWPWIIIFFFRFIFIFIFIVWRSPNKNTILHAGQKIGKKLGDLRAFATYILTITISFGDFSVSAYYTRSVSKTCIGSIYHMCQYSVKCLHRTSLERRWSFVCGMCPAT